MLGHDFTTTQINDSRTWEEWITLVIVYKGQLIRDIVSILEKLRDSK